ncbi:hypothetical protein [Actibacterium sp. XHP0104]|uniref:hypothetical protein n=1 Tax=Actibacterium sp. XHP0104 TaxID=2984335 RepID=UPI0021E7C914|nr:hypothetical protein [Actibacterium sp. XHP0104]MCV2881308.1 hypothetical protein [Actibacterium sp. XHP0104]
MMRRIARTGLLAAAMLAGAGGGQAAELNTSVGMQAYAFSDDPAFAGQSAHEMRVLADLWGNVDLAPGLQFRFDANLTLGEHSFARIDEATLRYDYGTGSLRLGADQHPWARTEFARLSNVLNPRDFRADYEGDTLIGTPMLQWSTLAGTGTIDVIATGWASGNAYRQPEQRLRPSPDLIGGTVWERPRATPGLALRYENSFDAVDLGVYLRRGPSYEAALVPVPSGVAPYYPWVAQAGLDMQVTTGALIGKLELRHTTNQPTRAGGRQDGWAAALGAEYTFFGVAGSDGDMMLFAEYAWDQRGRDAWQIWQDDLVLGARWSANTIANTRLSAGLQLDLDYDTRALRLRLEHRLADGLTADLSVLHWLESDPADLVRDLRKDSHLQITIMRDF